MQLAAVLDTGGVSEGAALLGLTQPAVSRSLSMLEAWVGEPLFLKGRRPLRPTPLGAQLATQGRAIIAASRRASDLVRGFAHGTGGHVRVAGVPFFMDAMISRMIGEFLHREPEVTIEQSCMNLPETITALKARQIDIGIVPVGEQDLGPELEFHEILPGRNIVACRIGHPLLRKRLLETTDLAEYSWVGPLPGAPLMSDLQMILTAIGMPDLQIRYAGGSLASVPNVLVETDALAVLPHSVVFAQRHDNTVTVLPYHIPQPARALGLLTLREEGRPAAVERFTGHVATAFTHLRHTIRRHETAVVWGPAPQDSP